MTEERPMPIGRFPQIVVSLIPLDGTNVRVDVMLQGLNDWPVAVQVLAEAVKIAAMQVVKAQDAPRVVVPEIGPVRLD
jgi:hypothetical protein